MRDSKKLYVESCRRIYPLFLSSLFRRIPVFLILPWLIIFSPVFGEREISTRRVGSGSFFSEIRDADLNLNFYILKVDLKHPSVRVEAALAHGLLPGSETVLDISRKNDRPFHRVIGAVNGDYFVYSYPSGMAVTRGRLIRMPRGWSCIAFASDNTPIIERFYPELSISDHAGIDIKINGINRRRRDDDIVLYTDIYGDRTVSGSEGTEFIVDPKGHILSSSSRFGITIVNKASLPISNPIPKGMWILSFSSSSSFLAGKIYTGSRWWIQSQIKPEFPGMFNAVEGGPRILRKGKISVERKQEGQRPGFDTERHPRTAVGYSRDRRYLVLAVVDGRQAESRGVNLFELAELMQEWGCSEALNLDGGGSSTMVIRNRLVNHPSDPGGARDVANALLIIEIEKPD